jgi:hypothetical protein
LKSGDSWYIDFPWNVEILWDDGTTSMEPLNNVAKDDPVSCSRYAKEYDLLTTEKVGRDSMQLPTERRRFAEWLSMSMLMSVGMTLSTCLVFKFPSQRSKRLSLTRSTKTTFGNLP